MNNLLLLLFALLIAGLVSPVYAQTLSEYVVINEVDTNPPGNDSTTISEWIELYNPTDFDVDLSGWEIGSTTVLKKTLNIPDGTVILPGKFLTFTYESVWFTDSSESVELRDADGTLVDKTPNITDLENDFSSWQRVYDGYDSADWKFVTSTAGASNGKVSPLNESEELIITLSADKNSYVFDESAVFKGTVSKRINTVENYFQPEPIMINISGPNYVQTISIYPDYQLNYESSIDLVQVLGINSGIYYVDVTYAGASATTTFAVDFELPLQDEVESVSSLNIATNTLEYFPGELVSISAFTNNVVLFESLVFTITDSQNELISQGNLFTTNGDFSTEILLNTVNPNYGIYTITAEYDEELAISTFSVLDPSVDYASIDEISSEPMILTTDDSEYVLYDYMVISGAIVNFASTNSMYAEQVKISFKDSNGKSPSFTGAIMDNSAGAKDIDFTSTAILDESGEFSVKLRIPYNIFFEGDYSIRADYGSESAFTDFTIISEKITNEMSPDQNAPVGNPNVSIPGKPVSNDKFENGYFVSNVKTIIEKVNRISDNLISIDTQEKIITNQPVSPRVLSGSMVTISKDSQSSVNLQVSSASGVCIIGTNSDCLVSESTRKPGQIFEVVQVDGLNLNVRYSGPDVRLEKFSILPQSSDDFLPNTNWNVQVIKDNEVSRFYYKVTYKTLQ